MATYSACPGRWRSTGTSTSSAPRPAAASSRCGPKPTAPAGGGAGGPGRVGGGRDPGAAAPHRGGRGLTLPEALAEGWVTVEQGELDRGEGPYAEASQTEAVARREHDH